MSGKTAGLLTTTVTAHTSTQATMTLASVAAVYPGDILTEATELNTSLLIRTVNSSVVDLGLQVSANINGNTVTVLRRALGLPSAGPVMEVYEKDSWRPLKYNPLVAARAQFETGTAQYYTQQFSETGGASYISLFPAPATSTQFVIVQFPEFTEDATLYMSEALISAILATAYEFRMAMSGPAGFMGAHYMAEKLEALRQRSSGSHGIIERS